MSFDSASREQLTADQIEQKFYGEAYERDSMVVPPSQVRFSTTIDDFKSFLNKTTSYITHIDASNGELIAEVLCLHSHSRGANEKFFISVLTSTGEVTDHESLILGVREISRYMARTVRIPLVLIDIMDFTLLQHEEQIRVILALREQVQNAHKKYNQIARSFEGTPIIKYHSVGDGFYIMMGQAEHSTSAIKLGQILFDELRHYNLDTGLHNKVYYRMVAHYGECTTVGGIDPTGLVSAEPMFIGEIFNDCSRILSACPRTEANLLYATEAAYDLFSEERGTAFSELRIATDAKGKKHLYHVVLPPKGNGK